MRIPLAGVFGQLASDTKITECLYCDIHVHAHGLILKLL